MSNPINILRPWKPGDTREVSERALKQVRLDGKCDSYSQIYEIDGRPWKIQGQLSHPSGDTLYTLACVNE
jgi:hypothetical protein